MLDKYAALIKENGGFPTLEIVQGIIKDHKPQAEYMRDCYDRYWFDQAQLPIMNRQLPDTVEKVDVKVPNDWFGEIVNTKVGYAFALPVGITYDALDEDEIDKETIRGIKQRIKRFNRKNNTDALAMKIGTYSAVCGYDAVLCYVDATGNERVMRLDPWEVAIITETELFEPAYSMRYYPVGKTTRVEFYNDLYRVVYEIRDNDLVEIQNDLHKFKINPLFGVPNNDALQSDGHKVFDLIDAYDMALSDFSSEVAQFRLSYFLFEGVKPSKEMIRDMIQTGAIYIPPAMSGEQQKKVSFLTKQVNDAAIVNLLDRLESNITRFARHVNFTEAAFGSDISSPAMKWKVFMLEQKAQESEVNHRSALRYMYAVLGTAWQTKDMSTFAAYDASDIELTYRRNIPANDKDVIDTAASMLGMTSRLTVYEYMKGIIPDAEKELRRWLDEKQGIYEFDDEVVEDGDDSTPNNNVTTDGTGVSSDPIAITNTAGSNTEGNVTPEVV